MLEYDPICKKFWWIRVKISNLLRWASSFGDEEDLHCRRPSSLAWDCSNKAFHATESSLQRMDIVATKPRQ